MEDSVRVNTGNNANPFLEYNNAQVCNIHDTSCSQIDSKTSIVRSETVRTEVCNSEL